jgi:hypothetical protein
MIFRVFTLAPQHLVLLLPLTFLVVEAGANAVFGYRRAIGGNAPMVVALLQAAMYAGVALLAAEIVLRWGGLTGKSQKTFAGVVLAGCLLWSQVCGWSIIGAVIGDAQVARETQALKGSITRDTLRGNQTELKKLADVGTPKEIQERIEAQYATFIKQAGKTVGEATNKCADPGWAPNTCKRVAELKADLARAERKSVLEKNVSAGVDAVGKGPQVSAGATDVAVPVGMMLRFGLGDSEEKLTEDARFWMQVFVVAMITLLATAGFPLVGFGHDRLSELAADPKPYLAVRTLLAAPELAMDLDPYGQPHAQRPPARAHDGLSQYQPQVLPPNHPSLFTASAVPPNTSHGGSSAHVAPNVTINVGADRPLASQALAGPESTRQRDGEQATSTPSRLAQAAPVIVDAPAAPDRPVDRSSIKAHLDQLAVFRAASLADAPGMMVSADDLVRRYGAWAGGRAMQREAFLTLFEQLVPMRTIGGVRHFMDVTFRIGARAS